MWHLLESNLLIGIILLLIIVPVYHKIGLLDWLFRKNGKNNEKNNNNLKKEIEELKENHLHEMQKILYAIRQNSEKELIMLEDIRDKLKK